MKKSNYLIEWERAAADLGFEVAGPFDLTLPSGAHIQVPLIVRQFGGQEGMLVLPDYELIKDLSDEIIQAGYGISVMDEPANTDVYDRDGMIQVLAQWEWYGPESDKPAWLPDHIEEI